MDTNVKPINTECCTTAARPCEPKTTNTEISCLNKSRVHPTKLPPQALPIYNLAKFPIKMASEAQKTESPCTLGVPEKPSAMRMLTPRLNLTASGISTLQLKQTFTQSCSHLQLSQILNKNGLSSPENSLPQIPRDIFRFVHGIAGGAPDRGGMRDPLPCLAGLAHPAVVGMELSSVPPGGRWSGMRRRSGSGSRNVGQS